MPFWLQISEKNLKPPWNHCGSAMSNHQRELCTQTYGKLLGGGGGHPENVFCCNFLKILMVSDKTIHKAFIIQKLYKRNPLENFLYQSYTLALMFAWNSLLMFCWKGDQAKDRNKINIIVMYVAWIEWTHMSSLWFFPCNLNWSVH